MRLARIQQAALAGAAAVLVATGVGGCGGVKTSEQGVKEPAREGLSIEVGGVGYNVFITRELNVKVPPDEAYYDGPPPEPGFTYYGVFIKACNHGSQPRQSVRQFIVKNNQGKEFAPVPMPANNAFAYAPRKLLPDECIPEDGSVAQLGPSDASLLMFKFALADTENRPLELELLGPYDLLKGKREVKTIELDL